MAVQPVFSFVTEAKNVNRKLHFTELKPWLRELKAYTLKSVSPQRNEKTCLLVLYGRLTFSLII